jgi:hypothetical protein
MLGGNELGEAGYQWGFLLLNAFNWLDGGFREAATIAEWTNLI